MAADDRTLSAPVGVGQPNEPADVRQVQHLLNRLLAAPHSDGHLAEDGIFGSRTQDRLTDYQQDAIRLAHPDGVASPDGPTMRSLSAEKAATHHGSGVALDAYSTEHLAPHGLSRQEEFIQKILPTAHAVHEKWNIPTSVLVAQEAWKSGWGTKAPGNEYFGVKAHGWSGPTHDIRTTAFDAKGKHGETDAFRAYGSLAEAGDDYGRFMTSQPRYRHAFEHTDDPHRFVEEVGKAKWGTDPNYAANINGVIRQHNLTRYDGPEQSVLRIKETGPTLPMGWQPPATTSGVPDAKAYWAAVAQRGRDAREMGLADREAQQGAVNMVADQAFPRKSDVNVADLHADLAIGWKEQAKLGAAIVEARQQAAAPGQQASTSQIAAAALRLR